MGYEKGYRGECMNNIFMGIDFSISHSAVIFATVLIFVLLAEIGDKTQFLVMALATKYKLSQVIIGVIISLLVLNGLAVFMGELLTTIIPIKYIQVFAGFAFIMFGIMAFRKEHEEQENDRTSRLGPMMTVAVSFFIAELGDKTQLAIMTFSAQYNAPFEVFCGALIGMIIADMLGLIIGVTLNKRIKPKNIRIISGLLFIGFGLISLGTLVPEIQLASIINSTILMIGILALAVIAMLMFAANRK